MDKKIVLFDVGSQNGEEFLKYNLKYNNVFTYAFEPTPSACKNIKTKITSLELQNFFLIEKAVSDIEGICDFYISAKDNEGDTGSGINSLNEFNSIDILRKDWGNLSKSNDKSVKKLNRFSVKDKIKVKKVRLDSFIEKNNISNINILHIDAQGHDFNVLKSLGQYINIVDAGMIEVVGENKTPLYKNVDNNIIDVIRFLENNNFEIISKSRNDKNCNEINVRFKSKNLNFDEVSEELKYIYKKKHFF